MLVEILGEGYLSLTMMPSLFIKLEIEDAAFSLKIHLPANNLIIWGEKD